MRIKRWTASVVVVVLLVIVTIGAPARADLSQPGLNGTVRSLHVQDNRLIAGGDFTLAGGGSAAHIAFWDDTGWHPLAAGLTGTDEGWACSLGDWRPTSPARIRAIIGYGGQLYAGGEFRCNAYGSILRALARWSAETWQSAGAETALDEFGVFLGLSTCWFYPPEVHCLTVRGGDLIVGGFFAGEVARWNGSNWQTLGHELYNDDYYGINLPAVDALITWRGELMAGGNFAFTGQLGIPLPSPHLVRLTTDNAWGSLVPPEAALDGRVYALAVLDDDLIVAGAFHNGGTTPLNRIGRWDGMAWHALGGGLPSAVHSLCVFNGDLYADGWKWDGASWQNVLAVQGTVLAMTVFRDRLVAGGEFVSALGANCGYIVSWPSDLVPVLLAAFQGTRLPEGVRLSWSVGAGAEGCEFSLWRESDGERQRVSDAKFSGSQVYTDRSAGSKPLRYWLRLETADLRPQEWFGPASVPALTIDRLRLYPNQPNPFNPLTTIRFDLPEAGIVRLSIYDLAGRLVRVLEEGEMVAGSYEAVWDGRDRAGRVMASGSYFARLEARGKLQTVCLSLVR